MTRYDYDGLGRLTRTTHPDGAFELTDYDAEGRRISSTDRAGRETRFVYDSLGRQTATIFPDGTQDITAYDGLGRTVKKTDQAGTETRFEYDGLGRLVKVIDALGQQTSYGYDEVGNRVSQTDANGHTTRFAYDSRGRRIGRMSISTEIFPGISVEKFPVERVRSGCLSALFALFKPVGVVAGFEDVAVVGDAVE